MSTVLKIVHLEDSNTDAELIRYCLKKAGINCEIKVVSDQLGFKEALINYRPDVILSDHSLPGFNSVEAFELVKAILPEVPFILITGAVSEEFAVACIKNGVDDYILKSHLARLPDALKNAVKKKQVLNKLRNSEDRYRQIVETAHEGIWMLNKEHETIFANQKMCDILEYSFEEMMGKSGLSFMTKESIECADRAFTKQENEHLELKCLTKSGKEIWMDLSTSALFDKEKRFMGILGMVTDITERKKAHEKLIQSEVQIRNFAKHLNETREEESGRIAREIHDELGQQLAGIKMSIISLKKSGSEDKQREQKIEGIIADVDLTIRSLRKIATELRPGILDSLGLIPSIEWMAGEFARKTGIACLLNAQVKQQKFEKELSICFFRVCQESLTNIAKHANAKKVIIGIEQRDHDLSISISDDGKGMTNEKLENPFSMGLLGMRERANLIGANLEISSHTNGGTCVRLNTKINL